MKKVILLMIGCCCLTASTTYSQSIPSLNIDSCYALAKRNYPLVKQYALLEQSKEYSVDNVNKKYLPQLNVAGQASYQSEVTAIPVTLPNVTPLSKDQYKLYGEVNQPLTDMLVFKDQKELIETNSEIEEQNLEVELYKLKERIKQLYFGILLIDVQLQQTELLKTDIQTGIDKTKAAIDNGIALRSSADLLNAELLKANQRSIELKTKRTGFTDMLSLFINQPISENTRFETPGHQALSNTINRPELKIFELQKQTIDVQSKLITAKTLPRFNLFFQGGLGRPALNMLSNDVKGYYIGGLRLNWNVSGFYSYNKEKQILTLKQNALDIQRETFLFNTSLLLKQQNSELTKLQELIGSDNEIILLRERIKNTAKSQLENGTATTNDYLTYVNAEDQAKQNKLLHQIQLLMAQYSYQTTSGN